MCRVELGDGQSVSALVDTGSGNLVVPSGACASAGCQGHRRFRPEEDSMGHFLGAGLSDVALGYASGHVGGSGFESRVCLGGACGQGRLVVAAFESEEFRRYPFDAILGLGMRPQAVGEGFNILAALAKEGGLASESFALALRAGGNATLSLAPDAEAMRAAGLSPEALAWFPVDSRHGEWALQLEGVSVDGERMDSACPPPSFCRAVLDSGTSGIALPLPVARALQRRLRRLGDCSPEALGALPSLSFSFQGNRTYSVPPAQYVEISAVDPSHCRLLIQPMDEDGAITRTAILGQAFLMDRYAVFNQTGLKIGIAPLPSAPPA